MGKELKNFKCKNKGGSNKDLPPMSEDFKENINKYQGMGEDALVSQLMSKVAQSKSDGTYNSAELKNFVKTVSPHLTREQRGKLERLVGVIENEE
ncbi:MAG: hypothetical protein FWC80_04345 [Firmicutes bacterium]|nr:hypothetical protein [Bacillota bacterium]